MTDQVYVLCELVDLCAEEFLSVHTSIRSAMLGAPSETVWSWSNTEVAWIGQKTTQKLDGVRIENYVIRGCKVEDHVNV